MSIKKLMLFLSISLVGLCAQAEVIEVPEEELAKESVLPIFNSTAVVRSRLVNLEGRFELGLNSGINLNDAYYNPLTFGLLVTYHFNEIHGVNISYNQWFEGLSTYGKQLKNGEGLSGGNTFDASLAPQLQSMYFLNYQFTAYYGKISLTKQSVMNLSLYTLAGLGMMNYKGGSEVAVNLGIGQRLYFSPDWALRFDLSMNMFSGIEPSSIDLPANSGEKSYSSFAKETRVNLLFSVGLVVLL